MQQKFRKYNTTVAHLFLSYWWEVKWEKGEL